MSDDSNNEGGGGGGGWCCCGGNKEPQFPEVKGQKMSVHETEFAVSKTATASTEMLHLATASTSFSGDSDPANVRGRARVYASVNEGKPESFFDSKKFKLEWGDIKDYKINFDQKLGEGAYGAVFAARNKDGDVVVVKEIKPDKSDIDAVRQEIRILMDVSDGEDIVSTLDLLKDKTEMMYIVMEFAPAVSFRKIEFTDETCRYYLYHLIKGLNYSHSIGIMHRDVKGDNVLYDPESGSFRLIDWGFGEHYRPGVKNRKWCGTRYYKAPEMFLHYEYYDYAVDMWSVGCMMGAMIFKTPVLFHGEHTDDRALESRNHLIAIVNKLGKVDWRAYLLKYRNEPYKFAYYSRYKHLPNIKRNTRVNWAKYRHERNSATATDDAIDLMNRLLIIDHELRITAKEALRHPYFADLYEADREFVVATMSSDDMEAASDATSMGSSSASNPSSST